MAMSFRLHVGATDRTRRAEPRACESDIQIRSTSGAEGCFIDVELQQVGRLRAPCDGAEGPAEAVFGSRTFRGRVAHGRLSLRLTTSFPFSDGCTWESNQTISGRMDAAQFDFHYSEHARRGERGCAPACTADGIVQRSR